MADGRLLKYLRSRVPGVDRLARLPAQLLGRSPFDGDIRPTRVPVLWPRRGRPSLPFPHPWNYDQPIRILEAYFWGADEEQGPGQHNRYLDMPGFRPVFVTRDPRVIRAIATETGDREGQFDRDTLPSVGIARATGADTLLFANGQFWKLHKKLAAAPFGKTTLFQPEQFREFADTFRQTVVRRLAALQRLLEQTGTAAHVRMEPEIKAVMLEMLTNKLWVPRGTHILLDIWHANRHEDHWGLAATGYPALDFVPERWEALAAQGRGSKEVLHFGFGHGPRVCPGKHLGQLEVALAVGAFVKLFRFRAIHAANEARAGVSTKPIDGVAVELELRNAPHRPATVEAASVGVNVERLSR